MIVSCIELSARVSGNSFPPVHEAPDGLEPSTERAARVKPAEIRTAEPLLAALPSSRVHHRAPKSSWWRWSGQPLRAQLPANAAERAEPCRGGEHRIRVAGDANDRNRRPARNDRSRVPALRSRRFAKSGLQRRPRAAIPRSPWIASARCRKVAVVPVEANVAAILRADMARLAEAATMSLPLQPRISSHCPLELARRGYQPVRRARGPRREDVPPELENGRSFVAVCVMARALAEPLGACEA